MHSLESDQNWVRQFESELRENILPFWMKFTPDRENGGFFGALTNDRTIRNEVERSAVLCGRILWTFSTAARLYQDRSYMEVADWAFDTLTNKFWDPQYQGVYWSIDKQGQPVQDRKHTYAQAFSIYGLSAYFQTTGNQKSLTLARQLFELIETHTYDEINGGNIECRARDWSGLDDMRLSDKDLNSSKSMNTLLHLMEAYAALYKVSWDQRILIKLEGLLRIFFARIIDSETGHQHLFFDDRWNSLQDHISYGHDIETSWLLLESAKISGNQQMVEACKSLSVRMAQAVYDESLGADGSILYESGPDGYKIVNREWWASAEAVVGFYNAYQLSGQEHFKEASERAWDYIQKHFVDRENGDWFKLLREDGSPILTQDKVGPWQCPYHHARMCFEMVLRMKESYSDWLARTQQRSNYGD